jgi:hypothetical protein
MEGKGKTKNIKTNERNRTLKGESNLAGGARGEEKFEIHTCSEKFPGFFSMSILKSDSPGSDMAILDNLNENFKTDNFCRLSEAGLILR